jgi:hypothetical protein
MHVLRAIAAAIVVLAVAVPASQAQTAVTFAGGFETGDLGEWSMTQSCKSNPAAMTVYSSASQPAWPVPTQGYRALRFHVLDSDVSPCTPTSNPRAQLLSDRMLRRGGEYWETFDVLFPQSFPDVPKSRWMLFQEDFGEPWRGSPPLGFGVYDLKGADSLQLRRDARFGYDVLWSQPLVRGQWYRFGVHKRIAPDSSGFVELWVNGVRQTFSDGSVQKSTPTMHPDATGDYRFIAASYRARGAMPGAVDTFLDNVTVIGG